MLCPVILIFQIQFPEDQDTIIEELQDGLAATIEEMPFLAADVIPENSQRGTVQLETTEEAGVWFHVKHIPKLDFEELELRNFGPQNFPVNGFMPEPRIHDFDRTPVLTVEATLISGGLLLVEPE